MVKRSTRCALSVLAALTLAGAAACGSTEPSGAGPTAKAQAAVSPGPEATAEAEGLRFTLEPVVSAKAGARLTATLVVGNPGRDERRLYTPPEPFRFPLHDVALWSGDGKRQGGPEAHPHGIVIGEEHFLRIGPGAEVRIDGIVDLPSGAAAGRYQLTWTVENEITQWQGGVGTLDGPTKTLFGGGPIPGIWTGEVTVRVPVVVR